jgi:hypothetical protein
MRDGSKKKSRLKARSIDHKHNKTNRNRVVPEKNDLGLEECRKEKLR